MRVALTLLAVFCCSGVFSAPDLCSIDEVPFRPLWNAPTHMCSLCTNESQIVDVPKYGICANGGRSMDWFGDKMVIFYTIGLYPGLKGSYNATPCWEPHKGKCSWNPWGNITVEVNGGVPQRANVTAHLDAVTADVDKVIPATNFSGFLVIDWERWRVPFSSNYDTHTLYTEYSKRLVRAQYPSYNASMVERIAELQFTEGATNFFLQTIKKIRKLRPLAKVGFYGYPCSINDVQQLWWLWDNIDLLLPSNYVESPKPSREDLFRVLSKRISLAMSVQGAAASQKPPRRLLLTPYVLDGLFLFTSSPVYTSDAAAASFLLPAAMGTDGIVLWGSSSSVRSCSFGCNFLSTSWQLHGKLLRECVSNATLCSNEHCSGHGRCALQQPVAASIPDTALCLFGPSPQCVCNAGYKGSRCANKSL